jgi:hypothetical protein
MPKANSGNEHNGAERTDPTDPADSDSDNWGSTQTLNGHYGEPHNGADGLVRFQEKTPGTVAGAAGS